MATINDIRLRAQVLSGIPMLDQRTVKEWTLELVREICQKYRSAAIPAAEVFVVSEETTPYVMEFVAAKIISVSKKYGTRNRMLSPNTEFSVTPRNELVFTDVAREGHGIRNGDTVTIDYLHFPDTSDWTDNAPDIDLPELYVDAMPYGIIGRYYSRVNLPTDSNAVYWMREFDNKCVEAQQFYEVGLNSRHRVVPNRRNRR